MKQIKLTLPYHPESFADFTPGTKVLLNGVVYTARDMAHKRILQMIEDKKELPFDLKETAIFHCGPSPARPGAICGAIGPTTSSRMGPYIPALVDAGLRVIIGKGNIDQSYQNYMTNHRAIFLVAIGGASAVLSQQVVSCETFLWSDLGAEAVYKMELRDFPCYIPL